MTNRELWRKSMASAFRSARVFLHYARRYPAGDSVRACYVAYARRHHSSARLCIRELSQGV